MKRRILGLSVLLLGAGAGCEQPLVVGVDPGMGGAATGTSTGTFRAQSRLTGPQPGMVGVTSPGGVTYYIDSTEVSQAAYALFLAASPAPDPTSAACGWKTTFAPGMEVGATYVGLVDGTACRPEDTRYDPVAHGDDPAVCVDWCDAATYCQWAGKRLCGRVGGGTLSGASLSDATQDQWYGACSNGGTTDFPYGASYVNGACNDGTAVAAVGQTPGCHGIAPPYDGIFDMSGNVAEWVDSCMSNIVPNDGAPPIAETCWLRGGGFFADGVVPPMTGPSFNDLAATRICGDDLGGQILGGPVGPRNLENEAVGFRCCVD